MVCLTEAGTAHKRESSQMMISINNTATDTGIEEAPIIILSADPSAREGGALREFGYGQRDCVFIALFLLEEIGTDTSVRSFCVTFCPPMHVF